MPNKEIADQLCLAEGTVKNYATSIPQKIGGRDHAQAAIRAKELGLEGEKLGFSLAREDALQDFQLLGKR